MGGRKDCCNSRVGTNFGVLHWLSLDPCGSAGVSTSFFIHIYALIVINFYLISNSFTAQMIFIILYLPAAVLAVSSLFMAWTTDPGSVPMGARPLVVVKRAGSIADSEADDKTNDTGSKKKKRQRERGIRRCSKCNDNYKPNRAHHDSVTGRCIVKMDHFCPWVGNAVGALNHKFFVLFIGYTMFTCLLTLLLLLMRAIHCGYYTADSSDDADNNNITLWEEEKNELQIEANSMGMETNGELSMETATMTHISSAYIDGQECVGVFQSVGVIVLMFVSFTFLIFTCCMFVEQIEAIQTNTGKIARMKMRVGQGGTELARVTEEFNEMFGGTSPNVAWHWFLPIPVTFPGGMRKVVLGYEWDDSIEPVPYKEPGSDNNTNNNDPSTNNNSTTTTTEAATDEIGNNDAKIMVVPEEDHQDDNSNNNTSSSSSSSSPQDFETGLASRKPNDTGRKIKKRTNSRGALEVDMGGSSGPSFIDKTNPIY